jgi:hypothetical protein
MHNRGGGTFDAPFVYGVPNHVVDVLLEDFTSDGKRDLLTANRSDGTVALFPGGGDGTFGAPDLFTIARGFGGESVAALTSADMDGDGDRDVVALSDQSAWVFVMRNDGHGRLAAAVGSTVRYTPVGMVAADLDKDGDTDLGITTVDTNTFQVSVVILFNRGDGTFDSFLAADIVAPISAAGAGGIAAVDVDGDGDFELAAAVGPGVAILTNDGPGRPWTQSYVRTTYISRDVAAGDLNGDGKSDIALGHGLGVTVLLGSGNGSFAAGGDYDAGLGFGAAVAIADFDGDGDLDLIGPRSNGDDVGVFRNHGDGTFDEAEAYAAGLDPRSVAVGDVNGDGYPDVAAGDFNGRSATFLLNAGPRERVAPRVEAVELAGTKWTGDFISALRAGLAGTAGGYAVPAGVGQAPQSRGTTSTRSESASARTSTSAGKACASPPRMPRPTRSPASATTPPHTWPPGRSTTPFPRTTSHCTSTAPATPPATRSTGSGPRARRPFPSGNGTAGGEFRFRFAVLGGDATRDGTVNALDLGDVKRRLNTTAESPPPSRYSVFADVNGDGRINALDLGAVRQAANRRLPPVAPAPSMVLLDASNVTTELLASDSGSL